MPANAEYYEIVDMMDRTVTVERPIDKVVTAGYGFIPCAMAALGVGDRIVGTGGAISALTTETTATYLIPQIKELPDLGRGYNLNLESAAALNPDVIILERDGAGQGTGLTEYDKLIEKLELFEDSFPTVVLNNPACYSPPGVSSIYQEIRILGELFDKQDRATDIIDYLESEVQLIRDRTAEIDDEKKPKVLFMGLMGGVASGQGAVALALPDYDCGTLFPDITKITNAYTGESRGYLSTEQILAIDPDLIILVRSPGGYEVRQLFEEEYYSGLSELRAIKERRIYSTGQFQLHRNLAGLEYPIEMLIAVKAAYPARFEDVKVGESLTEHYRALYGLSDEDIHELKAIMGLSWMDEAGF
jgi:iron complex transport system substrate-binding protein